MHSLSLANSKASCRADPGLKEVHMVAYTAEELRELASVADRTLGAADDDGDSDDDRERERKKSRKEKKRSRKKEKKEKKEREN